MSRGQSVIRLYLLDDRRIDLDHASLLVSRLASRRRVEGDLPEWRVLYETEDVSRAMGMCAADLEDLDPHWLEIFDFSAINRAWKTRVDRP